MSNPTSVVTERRLGAFYQEILPYLGGSADAGFTPIGSIIAIMGVTAPANYLACNGQIVNVADYPELANYFEQQFGTKYKFGGSGTTFGIPDLRGEFLRGTGTNGHSGNGNGADVGVHQNATQIPDVSLYETIFAIGYDGNNPNPAPNNKDSAVARTGYAKVTATKTSDSTANRSMFTTRPTNTSILWCIATKDIYLNPAMDYSTSEKVVGKWIDGKTLYQKTFVTEAPTVATQGTEVHKYIDIGASVDYAEVVNCNQGSGVSFVTIPTKYWLRTTETPNNARPVYYAIPFINNYGDVSYKNKLRLTCSDTGTNGHTFYITLRYTKTT